MNILNKLELASKINIPDKLTLLFDDIFDSFYTGYVNLDAAAAALQYKQNALYFRALNEKIDNYIEEKAKMRKINDESLLKIRSGLQFILDDDNYDETPIINNLHVEKLDEHLRNFKRTATILPNDVTRKMEIPKSHWWWWWWWDNNSSINRNSKSLLYEFINNNNNNLYYKIFFHLKLMYGQYYYRIKNVNRINIISAQEPNNNNNNTFLSVMGLSSSSFFIPPNLIINYFTKHTLKTINRERENTHVTNKLDLYFSLLTLIYFHSLSTSVKNQIEATILENIEREKNEKIIHWLYESNIYDFSRIKNEIKDFKYNFQDIKVAGSDFFQSYNDNVIGNEKNTADDYTRACHHLITIFRFYEQYVQSYFFTDKNSLYRRHPLTLVQIKTFK